MLSPIPFDRKFTTYFTLCGCYDNRHRSTPCATRPARRATSAERTDRHAQRERNGRLNANMSHQMIATPMEGMFRTMAKPGGNDDQDGENVS